MLLLSTSNPTLCLPSILWFKYEGQAFPLLLVCLDLVADSSWKQYNWIDILMKHFLGSTQTIVAPNYSFSICLFGWEGLIWINPIEFKCLDLNLLSKKAEWWLKKQTIWQKSLFHRLMTTKIILGGQTCRNLGMQQKDVLLFTIHVYFPQGSQSIRQNFIKMPSIANPVAVFHHNRRLPF